MPCPVPAPDHGVVLMWSLLALGFGLAVGKTWGDRDRKHRIFRRRYGPDR